jgi:hypothetical protein
MELTVDDWQMLHHRQLKMPSWKTHQNADLALQMLTSCQLLPMGLTPYFSHL